jgi:signal transduction histidine kinase
VSALIVALIAPLALSLFTAAVNYGVWFHRREELAHRALAMTCLACAVLLAATCLVYTSDSRADAIFARTLVFVCAIPGQVGSVLLTERAYRKSFGAHVWLGASLSLLLAALGLVPGVLYADGAVTRTIQLLGIEFVDVALTPFGRLAPLALVAPAVLLAAYSRKASADDSDRTLVRLLSSFSSATVLGDMLLLGGWVDWPFLYPPTFALVGVLYTGIMLRHFVASLARVEASADLLQRAAESGARDLREADLRLAHGARLAALGTLAAGLAHEINNPVAFIRSNLNYLSELAANPRDDAELEEVLGETEQGVARLRGIVDELLRMSTQSGGRFGEVLLSEVVEAALPTLRFEARGDVALEARLAPVPAILGDRNLLGQIVANLVINAIQSVRSAGSSGQVRIATFADGQRAVLEVSDSGPGVPPELAERIFEPFFTTKPAGEGTGLGLAVTHRLVERHGGRLVLLGSERGARVQVQLPLARAAAGIRPRTSAPATTDTAAADPAIPAS